MKKLLDETTDDLTRALLVAGLEHRPPANNKAQLIVALGAGGALGLFSSNAFAWLGTTSGKVTMLGVAVGVAGAVYATVLPETVLPQTAMPQAAMPQAAMPARATERPAVVSPVSGAAVAPDAVARNEVVSKSADRESAAVELVDDVGSVRADAVEAPARAAPSQPRLAKIVAPKWSEPRRNGPLPAVLAPPAVGAYEADAPRTDAPRADARLAGTSPSALVDAEDLDGMGAANLSLDAEVKLVDDMHWAARRNDREALGRFLETYRVSFPDGQLKREVAQFAARLERPAR